MPKSVTVAILAFSILFTSFIYKAQAAEPLFVSPGEPFSLQVTLSPPIDVRYAVKIRIFSPRTGDYSGETWNNNAWLKQTTSWDKFPIVSGPQTFFMTGRVESFDSASVVQVAVRNLETEKVEVIIERPIISYDGQRPLSLTIFNNETQQLFSRGFFQVQEAGQTRFVPLLGISAETKVTNTDMFISFYSADGSKVFGPKSYVLEGEGWHKIEINRPERMPYALSLVGPSVVYPNQPMSLIMNTDSPIESPIEWFVDGVKTEGNAGTKFTHTFLSPGQENIQARVIHTGQTINHTVTVEPYRNIIIESLTPNPEGSDKQAEKIVIRNNNPFTVTLTNWQLKSRSSSTVIPISGVIAPNSSLTITTSNKLINAQGAYDLLDESRWIVDTVTYTGAKDNVTFIRQGFDWVGVGGAVAKDSRVVKDSAAKETIAGEVVKPSGRTIDIRVADGRVIRVVVHASFNGTKPRLHKGDSIRVSGIWKRSRRGEYLSVREDDELTILSTAGNSKASKAKKKNPRTSKKFYSPITTANAAGNTLSTSNLQSFNNTLTAAYLLPFSPTKGMTYVFSSMVTLGLLLCWPSRKFME